MKAILNLLLFSMIIDVGQGAEENATGHDSTFDVFPPKGYRKDTPRAKRGHNSTVYTGLVLWLEAVTKVDVSIMEFEVYGYIVQEWKDERLKRADDNPLILRSIDTIWLPDVYCVNCRESTLSKSDNRNSMIRIDPEGNIYYSQGVRLSASCPMNLMSFPFDKQRCTVQFASYSYNTSFLKYYWNGKVVLNNYELDQFQVQQVKTSDRLASYKSGSYSILSAHFVFVRRMGFYVIQVYLPTAMLVSLSWITFYMNPSDIGDRLTIGITLILTMIFLLGYINTSLPKVSYIKAVDWYLIASLIIIILGVVEGVIAYGLHFKFSSKSVEKDKRKHEDHDSKGEEVLLNQMNHDSLPLRRLGHKRHKKAATNDVDNNVPALKQNETNDGEVLLVARYSEGEVDTRQRTPKLGAKKIRRPTPCYAIVDSCCKILFPLTFVVFNVLYFWFYHENQWHNVQKSPERKN